MNEVRTQVVDEGNAVWSVKGGMKVTAELSRVDPSQSCGSSGTFAFVGGESESIRANQTQTGSDGFDGVRFQVQSAFA
jgi:hypothetical protein